MNLQKLKAAEALFMSRYPGGFLHPEMVAIGKKHKMNTMVDFAQSAFHPSCFDTPDTLIEDLVKLTTRSSMVSVFEKPRFRDYVYGLSDMDKQRLVDGVYQRLHGKAEKGFNQICDVLKPGKLAKWSLVTVCPAYYAPTEEVFIKPTTTKGVIAHFDCKELHYHPTPTWAFYEAYREVICTMKAHVDRSLSPSHAAFSGFLMMSL